MEGDQVALEEEAGVVAGGAEAVQGVEEEGATEAVEEVGGDLLEGRLPLDETGVGEPFEGIVPREESGGLLEKAHRGGGRGGGGLVVPQADEMGGEGEGPLLPIVNQDGPGGLHDA